MAAFTPSACPGQGLVFNLTGPILETHNELGTIFQRINLTYYEQDLNVTKIKLVANPDISGIGVLVGFVATAYITYIMVVILYIMSVTPELHENEIDHRLLASLWGRDRTKEFLAWERMLRKSVLMLSDQQLVTGVAILASGFFQLGYDVSAYHWQMMIYLAWFSSLTHLSTLTILRHYFRENAAISSWRAPLMLITFGLSVVALLPTGTYLWTVEKPDVELAFCSQGLNFTPGTPTRCIYQRLSTLKARNAFSGTWDQFSAMVFSILVLAFSYLHRGLRISKGTSSWIKLWLRTKPEEAMTTYMKNVGSRGTGLAAAPWVIRRQILLTSYVLLRALFDLYDSVLWEIIWLTFGLVWGSLRLFSTCWSAPEVREEERRWAFGQWVAVLLLILPLLSLIQNYHKAMRKQRKDNPSVFNRVPTLDAASSALSAPTEGTRSGLPAMHSRRSVWVAEEAPGPLRSLRSTGIDIAGLHKNDVPSPASRLRRRPSAPQSRDPDPTSRQDLSGAARLSSPSSGEMSRQDFDLDCYKYPWFKILVGLLIFYDAWGKLLVICTSGQDNRAGRALDLLGYWFAISFGILIGYTAVFVFVEDNRETIVARLERHVRMKAEVWHGLSTVAPWVFILLLVPGPSIYWLYTYVTWDFTLF